MQVGQSTFMRSLRLTGIIESVRYHNVTAPRLVGVSGPASNTLIITKLAAAAHGHRRGPSGGVRPAEPAEGRVRQARGVSRFRGTDSKEARRAGADPRQRRCGAGAGGSMPSTRPPRGEEERGPAEDQRREEHAPPGGGASQIEAVAGYVRAEAPGRTRRKYGSSKSSGTARGPRWSTPSRTPSRMVVKSPLPGLVVLQDELARAADGRDPGGRGSASRACRSCWWSIRRRCSSGSRSIKPTCTCCARASPRGFRSTPIRSWNSRDGSSRSLRWGPRAG